MNTTPGRARRVDPGPTPAVARATTQRALIGLAVFGGLFLLGLFIDDPWPLIVLALLGLLVDIGFWALTEVHQRAARQHGRYPTDGA